MRTYTRIKVDKESKGQRHLSTIQITNAKVFLNDLTGYRLNDLQLVRSIAYLRAKGVVFYDNWSREHCLLVADLDKHKPTVIEALKVSLYL